MGTNSSAIGETVTWYKNTFLGGKQRNGAEKNKSYIDSTTSLLLQTHSEKNKVYKATNSIQFDSLPQIISAITYMTGARLFTWLVL